MDRLAGSDPEIVKNVTKGIPLQRYGRIAEIADAGLFLFSPAASYVTGSVLIVDGGSVSRLSTRCRLLLMIGTVPRFGNEQSRAISGIPARRR